MSKVMTFPKRFYCKANVWYVKYELHHGSVLFLAYNTFGQIMSTIMFKNHHYEKLHIHSKWSLKWIKEKTELRSSIYIPFETFFEWSHLRGFLIQGSIWATFKQF